MTYLKKISVFALSCLMASPAWAGQVEFCKVIRSFDEKDLSAAPQIGYEDCAGAAFLDYGKYFVKAACWPGAVDLLEGKCELHQDKGPDIKTDTDESFETDAEQLQ